MFITFVQRRLSVGIKRFTYLLTYLLTYVELILGDVGSTDRYSWNSSVDRTFICFLSAAARITWT